MRLTWLHNLFGGGKRNTGPVAIGTRQVVFDCETDGLNPKKNRILSLGALEIIDGRIILESAFELRIARPEFDGGGAEVHELTQRELALGISEAEAIDRFVDFAQDATLVGHFVEFDVALVQNALDRLGRDKLENVTFDTMEVMRSKYPEGMSPGRKSWPLGLCAEKYGLPRVGAHTALGDAHMTALLFLALTNTIP